MRTLSSRLRPAPFAPLTPLAAALVGVLAACGSGSGASGDGTASHGSGGAAGQGTGGEAGAGSEAGTGGEAGSGGEGGDAGQGGGGGAAGGGPSGRGLPCDVQAVLDAKCVSCHGSTPTQSAPMSMVTAADLRAPAPTDPGTSVGALSVARMQDPNAPMPPAPNAAATNAEIAAMQAWVAAGMPDSTCADAGAPPPVDAGPDAPPADDPFAKPPLCTSNAFWIFFDLGTDLMHPGMACNTCHAQHGKKQFTIAGTAYPTGHEPDNCNSIVPPGAAIVVTDANNQQITVPINGVGNFRYEGPIAQPYHVKVVAGGKERAMSASPTTGDCNSCHTQTGANSAPGRIVFP